MSPYFPCPPISRIDADGHFNGCGNGDVSDLCNIEPSPYNYGEVVEYNGGQAPQQNDNGQNDNGAQQQDSQTVEVAQNQTPPANNAQPATQNTNSQAPLQYDMNQHVPPLPAAGPILPVLQCMQSCSQFVISSTSENTPVHPAGTPHRQNLAADLEVRPGRERATLQCAANCGAHFGLNERAHPSAHATGPHVHVQVTPGRNGGRGDLPLADQ